MKLRTQILTLGVAGALAAALAGGIGLFSALRLGAALDRVTVASSALQSSQLADMMHDAIRGDGQLAMLSVLEHDEAPPPVIGGGASSLPCRRSAVVRLSCAAGSPG